MVSAGHLLLRHTIFLFFCITSDSSLLLASLLQCPSFCAISSLCLGFATNLDSNKTEYPRTPCFRRLVPSIKHPSQGRHSPGNISVDGSQRLPRPLSCQRPCKDLPPDVNPRKTACPLQTSVSGLNFLTSPCKSYIEEGARQTNTFYLKPVLLNINTAFNKLCAIMNVYLVPGYFFAISVPLGSQKF